MKKKDVYRQYGVQYIAVINASATKTERHNELIMSEYPFEIKYKI